MFLKPFRIKSNSQMKSTERKNFRATLAKKFPTLTEDDILTLVPNKEVIASIKVITHNDTPVMIFTVKKLPIVFEYEKIMYPTVYFLWQFPSLIPTFTTHPQVFSKLIAGADLMLPGVILSTNKQGPAKYGKFEKGDYVSINLSNNKAPVAVGTTAHSSMDMFMAAGRGKCVNILHIFGDKLWSLDDSIKHSPPELGPPEIVQNENNDKDIIETSSEETKISENILESNSTELDNTRENSEVVEPNAVESMDSLLVYCFLKALKYCRKDIKLPILTSNFYRLHMVKLCPSNKTLDIKRSSFKKLNKFLSKMTEEGLIKISEMQKGVDSIVSIDYEHSKLLTFVCDSDDKKTDEISADNKEVVPSIIEAYTITAAVQPLFAEVGLSKGESVLTTNVRKHVTDYVRKHNLQDVNDKKMVSPNDFLKKLLKSEGLVSWEELMSKVTNAMGSCYKVTYKDSFVSGKGKIEPITMVVGTRSGNKKVTIVDNLELYGIRINEFAKECQHGVAASTTVSLPPGKKSQQMQIQGNQIKFLHGLLTDKYKINKKYIRGLEFAVKAKK